MKVKYKILIIVLIAFVGIQFIPTNRNQNTLILESDFNSVFSVPSNIQETLKISCYDCHSNNTYYPWYNKIQPVSWMMQNHVNNGKKELNFSEFGAYSKRKQKSKLKSIISQIKDDKMPIFSYTLIHGDAKISESDKKLITNWLSKLRDSIP